MKNDTITETQVISFDNIRTFDCPVYATAHMLTGKWKLNILYQLRDGEKRFGELKHSLGNITQAMLSNQLKDLERLKIVQRRSFNQVPLRVEYSLTESGKSLISVIKIMEEWGVNYSVALNNRSGKCVW